MDRQKLYIPITIIMALSAMFWPFWATALIFLAGLILFDNFYVGLVIFFTMDAVYGFELFRVGPVYGILTIGGILLFLLMNLVKGKTSIINR